MIENFAKFEKQELISIFGENNCFFKEDFNEIIGVSVDSRKINQSNLFIALKGESIDGHSKIVDAINSNASLIISEYNWYENNKNDFNNCSYILVKNTLNALGLLANYHRKRFDYPVVAIGGANGKTTTKEITAHILSYNFNVLKTFENFNNQLGVPLMLLSMNDTYNAAVFEIGTNEHGEISILANMVEPDFGLITNIGKEHLEKLIDLDGVEMEETFLFGYLNKHNKMSVINFDDTRLVRYHKVIEKFFSYGAKSANLEYTIELTENLNPKIALKYKGKKAETVLSTIGQTTAFNAVAGAAIALSMGMEFEIVIKALSEFKPVEYHNYGRMFLEKINDIKILNDCYNANPSSMIAGLDTLNLIDSKTKLAVLGDMRELGDATEEEHLEILSYASKIANKIFTYGVEMKKASVKLNLSNVISFEDKSILAKELITNIEKDCSILVKGSRGTKMEDVIIKLKESLQ